MKKTEWLYEPNTNKWWMVTVASNTNEMPTLKLPYEVRQTPPSVKVKAINLMDDNRRLWRSMAFLMGCLGASLAANLWFVLS